MFIYLYLGYEVCDYNQVKVRYSLDKLDIKHRQRYFKVVEQLQQDSEGKFSEFNKFYHIASYSQQARDPELIVGWSRMYLYYVELAMKRLDDEVPIIPYWNWANTNTTLITNVLGTEAQNLLCSHTNEQCLTLPKSKIMPMELKTLQNSKDLGHLGYQLHETFKSLSYILTENADELPFYDFPISLNILAFHEYLATKWLEMNPDYQSPKRDVILQPWGITLNDALFNHSSRCRAYY